MTKIIISIAVSIVAGVLTLLAIFLLFTGFFIHQGKLIIKVINETNQLPINNVKASYNYDLEPLRLNYGYDNAKTYSDLTDNNGKVLFPSFTFFKLHQAKRIWINFEHPDYFFENINSTDKFSVVNPSFFKQEIEITMIPKLKDSISKCESINDINRKDTCISWNIPQIAIQNKDAGLCSMIKREYAWRFVPESGGLQLFDEEECLYNFARNTRSISICDRIYDIELKKWTELKCTEDEYGNTIQGGCSSINPDEAKNFCIKNTQDNQ